MRQLTKESRDRLEKEIYELDDRISKLRGFVKANIKLKDIDFDFSLIVQQGAIMSALLETLKMRLASDTAKVMRKKENK